MGLTLDTSLWLGNFNSKNLISYYLSDVEFRHFIDKNAYTYVDGKLVLKSDEYLMYQDDRLLIKNDIADSPRLYCLQISPKIKTFEDAPTVNSDNVYQDKENTWHGNKRNNHPFSSPKRSHIHKYDGRDGRSYGYGSDNFGRSSFHTMAEKPIGTLKDAENIIQISEMSDAQIRIAVSGSCLHKDSFGEVLTHYMDRNNFTVEELAERIGIQGKTIQRYRNDKSSPKKRYIIGMCVLLKLNEYESIHLLGSAGYTLSGSMEDYLYNFMIKFASQLEINDCNIALKQRGYKPICEVDVENNHKEV